MRFSNYYALILFLLTETKSTVAQQKRGVASSNSYGPRQQKPNIVLILTDDQDVELGSLNYMPKTLKAIKYQGAEFRHAYVTTPMCCPSRSSLLTGMYVHNHNVFTNNDNCSSTTWQTTHETRSFATYLSNAGYRTGYFGKYLNKYNGSYIPPGWREWGGLIMNSKYYNYSINMNGKKIKHGSDYSKDYYPDLIANDSIAFLRQSKKNSAHKPVMLTMSFPAPHGPEDSAPQFSDLFFNVTSHHIPSYDYAPNPDKQWILQVTKKMQPIHKQFTDLLMTKRLQTLQSVDAAVQRVVDELEVLGELQNTYIIYTSDHGYHLGQFGLIKGKSFPFEFDVRVPFLVRGPGIDPGAVIDEIVLNIDLAPTFLDIAGVETPSHMDGRSMLPLFLSGNRKRLKWPDTFLIESSGRREMPHLEARLRKNHYFLTRTSTLPSLSKNSTTLPEIDEINTESSITTTPNRIYESEEEPVEEDEDDDDDTSMDTNTNSEIQKSREVEMEIQEEEITNQDTPPLKREQMQLDNRVLPGFIPLYGKLERLVKECSQPDMQKPCVANQKWYCEYDNGRWRKHKCKSNPHIAERYKKCACFTSRGVVYKKIPIETTSKKSSKSRKRNRRDADLSSIISKAMDIGKSNEEARIKRETLEEVDNVMSTIKGQINELQFVNTSLDEQLRSRNLETNLISSTISGCKILSRGNVNCSNQVYNNRRAWQKSRHEVNNEIHELKDKLEQLKEIRRHLKHYRPQYGPDSSGNDSSMEVHLGHHARFGNKRKHHRKGEIRRVLKPIKSKNIGETTTEITTLTMVNNNNNAVVNTTEANKRKHKHQKFQSAFSTEKRNPDEIPHPMNDCVCEISDEDSTTTSIKQPNVTQNKKRIDEEKMRRKARRQRKKESMDKQCSSEKMNCFHHDNDHWKTVPLWTNGPFCFCMNSNNNTYSCVRTINVTHNFLYCEFTTGLRTFYNLRIDPFELQNRFDQLKPEEKVFLHDQLKELVACKGRSCTVNQSVMSSKIRNNSAHKPFANNSHRYKNRKVKPDEPSSEDAATKDKRFSRLMLSNSSHLDRRISFGTARRKRKLQRNI